MDLRYSQNEIVGRAINEAAAALPVRARIAAAIGQSGAPPAGEGADSVLCPDNVERPILRCGVNALNAAVLGP